MSNLYDYNIADLKKILGDIGEPAFAQGKYTGISQAVCLFRK